jgi:hypothetical protein
MYARSRLNCNLKAWPYSGLLVEDECNNLFKLLNWTEANA